MARSVAIAALVLVACAADAHAQCALCREALRKSGDAGLIQGIYISILMLTIAPAGLVAGIALLLRRAYREKLRQEPNPCARN